MIVIYTSNVAPLFKIPYASGETYLEAFKNAFKYRFPNVKPEIFDRLQVDDENFNDIGKIKNVFYNSDDFLDFSSVKVEEINTPSLQGEKQPTVISVEGEFIPGSYYGDISDLDSIFRVKKITEGLLEVDDYIQNDFYIGICPKFYVDVYKKIEVLMNVTLSHENYSKVEDVFKVITLWLLEMTENNNSGYSFKYNKFTYLATIPFIKLYSLSKHNIKNIDLSNVYVSPVRGGMYPFMMIIRKGMKRKDLEILLDYLNTMILLDDPVGYFDNFENMKEMFNFGIG